jgi:hypothetical protein
MCKEDTEANWLDNLEHRDEENLEVQAEESKWLVERDEEIKLLMEVLEALDMEEMEI